MKSRLFQVLFISIAILSSLSMERPPAAKPAPSPAPSGQNTTIFPTPPPAFEIPEDTRPFKNAPEAAGLKVDSGSSDEEDTNLTPSTEFTILFPDPMVTPDRIDAEDSQSPIVAWPDLDAKWIWRTQSQGVWSVNGPLIPDQVYHLRLREGLQNLAGSALPINDWGIEEKTTPFYVRNDSDTRENLNSQPQIPLKFTYPVRLSDAAEGIWFQNRATRERYPAEILLNYAVSTVSGDTIDVTSSADIPAPKEFRVRPRDPLPIGHYYDLIVEKVYDAYSGRSLPYPEVFALGTTSPLTVDFVAARNWPTDHPYIEVKFGLDLSDDPLPENALTIEPAVPNLSIRKEGPRLLAAGDFDTSIRYKVTISDQIKGSSEYPLSKAETWGATFHPKPATLLFPGERVFRQRSALGLRFALLQANTGPVTWRLAHIPLEELATVQEAMKTPTKLLVDELKLEVVGQGELPASDNDREEIRNIEWKPADHSPALSGAYLVEAAAKDNSGKTIANTALIYFNETVFTQKTTANSTELRLARMSDAQPVAGISVKVLTRSLSELAHATTDKFGVVTFPTASLAGAAFFIADTSGTPSIESAAPGFSFPNTGSSYSSSPDILRGQILTDRPLYRPGEEVHFKGFLRINQNEKLITPSGAKISWQIISSARDERVAEGTSTINTFGGWDAAWTIPKQGRLGYFRILAKIGDLDAGNPGNFNVEEFRNPAFSVICEPIDQTRPAETSLNVSSQYFHGAPNVGSTVKWTATWISDFDGEFYNYEDSDGYICVDLYSEHHRTPVFEMEVNGEASLDAKGHAILTCAAPFKDTDLRARCTVYWKVDVTGPDGQTITGGQSSRVFMNNVTLGVRADRDRSNNKDIVFDVQAKPWDEEHPAHVPAEVQANLFLVQTKSVKERLAPFVYRYRNTDAYIPIEQKNVPANGSLTFTPKEKGRYVLVVSPLPGQPGITVSDDIYLTGNGEAQLPVTSDQKLEIKSLAGDKPVPVNTNAAFNVLSPSPGIAWVTVETDHVLDTYTVPLPGNATRIEVPMKPGYAPNVYVSIYALRPGGSDTVPGEMYGSINISVTQPETQLALAVSTDRPEYQPRDKGKITIKATANGMPVPHAEITLSVVDDSILELGGWTLPSLLSVFYPDHPFNVATRIALAGYIETISEKNLTQKGYVVGESGKDEFGNTEFVREDFRPLILWLPTLTTGKDGIATTTFTTPDNLSRFRVVAIAQTKQNQFGSADSTFTLSKPLIVEPALPRFLRQGDQVELRAVARQKSSPEEKLTVRCFVNDGLTLDGPDSVECNATQNNPSVTTFRAKVAENATSVTVRFSAKSATGLSDEVEITIPVATRTIQVRESVAGAWSGATFEPAKQALPEWLTSSGETDITLSTSPYLSKLLGIPTILEYPHGCFEQKSSRLLVYTALAKLLAYLPQPEERDANYRRVIEETLKEFDKSLLPDDLLPYWPFGTEGDPFVTIQAAWAVAQAQQAGYEIPEALDNALPRALSQIAQRKSRIEVEPTLRAFAMCVLSQITPEPEEDLTAAANELFLNRERLTDEGHAMLAIAFHTWKIEPEKQQELIREIPEKFDPRAFNPKTFSSGTRAEAICTWARLLITPDVQPQALEARLQAQMQNSASLSTQENLWLLIAFNALLQQNPPAKLDAKLAPKPNAFSANRSAAIWIARNLEKLGDLTIKNARTSGAYVMSAQRSIGSNEQKAVDKGLRIERIVKNLTDASRLGTAEAPFKLGDQILISFRFHSERVQNYVAVEDPLPAGLEILNPNLEMIGKFYQIPDAGVPTAWLSYSEMRDRQTNLYFDELPAGTQSYAILARATAAGSFAWPSTQMTPMYDSRYYARTAPSTCVVTE